MRKKTKIIAKVFIAADPPILLRSGAEICLLSLFNSTFQRKHHQETFCLHPRTL